MTTRIAPLTFATLAVLTLSACGSPAVPTPTTAAPANDTPPTASAAPTPESEDGAPRAVGQCPEGRWLMDNDVWARAMESTMPAGMSVESVTGEVWITHEPDGTYTAEYDEWGTRYVDADGTTVLNRDGVDTGTWSQSVGTITVTELSQDSEFTGYVETEQGQQPLPTGADDAPDLQSTYDYACQGDTMVTTTDGIELDFTHD